jgi:hypothetical protein
MRSRRVRILAAVVFLSSTYLWAQENAQKDKPQNRDSSPTSSQSNFVSARLSYSTSAAVGGERARQICLAVTREGGYRFLQLASSGGTAVALQGKLSDDQLQQLKKLLSDSEFRRLKGGHGGVIFQDSESFGAEISREDGAQRLQWLNPDDQQPFPDSATKLIQWMQNFKPADSEPLLRAEFSGVCPTAGFQLVQPTVATNTQP